MNRYHRQMLLPQIGAAGQARLAASRVLVVGCGALGSGIAEQLVRAGVGHLRIVDRDIVELTNLQRQVLYDERDVAEQTPKAIAAARRLSQINHQVAVEPIVADAGAANIEELAGFAEANDTGVLEERDPSASGDAHSPPAEHLISSASPGGPDNSFPRAGSPSAPPARPADGVDLILDGTDNVQTRYLLNDVSVKHGVPWIYGACVGMAGRMMPFIPPGPCLRCLFPAPPDVGELPTCDTAGVFSPVAAVVAALQSAAGLKLLLGHADAARHQLHVVDLWSNHFRTIDAADAKRPDCITCGERRFEFLNARDAQSAVSLCGRRTLQIRPPRSSRPIGLQAMAAKLATVGRVEATPYLVRCALFEPADIALTAFPDGRLLIHGTADVERARSIYARFIGV